MANESMHFILGWSDLREKLKNGENITLQQVTEHLQFQTLALPYKEQKMRWDSPYTLTGLTSKCTTSCECIYFNSLL